MPVGKEIKDPLCLIVDDDEMNRLSFSMLIENSPAPWGEWRIQVAHDAFQAEEMIDDLQGEVTIVLLDLQMPARSGIDLLHILKEKYGSIPTTIFVTAQTGSRQACLNAGAVDVLFKPVDPAHLMEKLMEHTI